jgi:hypothetical protein
MAAETRAPTLGKAAFRFERDDVQADSNLDGQESP